MKQLSKEQSDFFFAGYYAILYYACTDIKPIEKEDFFEAGLPLFFISRDHLFKNRELFDDYIEDVNKVAAMDERRLTLLNNMKKARYSDFIAVERDGLIYFVDYHNNNAIYQITGISQDAIELFQFIPCRTKTAVFNFEGCIVSDGMHDFKQRKYPSNASKAIMRDFEKDLEEKLVEKIG